VIDIRGDKVRLGVSAPLDVSVHRSEVYEAIARDNRQGGSAESPGALRARVHRNTNGDTAP
jgi:carbon storage regulator